MQVELAEARQQRLERIALRAQARTVRLWRQRMGQDFDASWARLERDVVAVASDAQVAATVGASAYVASTARADGLNGEYGGPVNPTAWAGVDGSGRDLSGLLFGAVTTAKTLIGRGAGLQAALAGGGSYMSAMTTTAVMDAGRSANLTAGTSHSYTHYVRVVQPGACSRCAILAGIQTSSRTFRRHPACRCSQAPETETELSGKYGSPDDYFQSLSKDEQDRVFTKAGAEAIRAGADPITVVTARRGAPGIEYSSHLGGTGPNSGRRMIRSVIGHNPDGTPILGYVTGEGTTRRGAYAKQGRIATGTYAKRVRVMPETLIALTDDTELRKVLLRDAGFIGYPATAGERGAPLGGTFFARRAELIREDRRIVDAFYRTRGINLG